MIERYKSGFVPPDDFRFEPATGADATDSAAATHAHNHLTAARGTVSGHRIKKRGGLLSIFSSNKVRPFTLDRIIPKVIPNYIDYNVIDIQVQAVRFFI